MNGPHDAARRTTPGSALAVIPLGGVVGVAVGLAGVYGIGRLTGNAAARSGLRRRWKPPAGWRRWPAAKWPRFGRQCPEKPAGCWPSRTAAGPQNARRLARPHRAAEPVGDLVRALPQGDAGARRLAGQARRRGFRGGGGQHRHPRSRQAEGLAEEASASTRSAYYADNSAKVFQDLKAVGKAFGMPTTLIVDPQRLRARDAGGAGGMGERRRDQARHRSAAEITPAQR